MYFYWHSLFPDPLKMGETSKFHRTLLPRKQTLPTRMYFGLCCDKSNHSVIYQMFTGQIIDYQFCIHRMQTKDNLLLSALRNDSWNQGFCQPSFLFKDLQIENQKRNNKEASKLLKFRSITYPVASILFIEIHVAQYPVIAFKIHPPVQNKQTETTQYTCSCELMPFIKFPIF